MRIKLTIDHLPHQKLPINYQYLISSWIYSVLYASDNEFATWLHEHGYELNGKQYKHFCFSMLKPQRFKVYPKEKVFELEVGPTQIVLSFNIEKAGKDIIKGLFKDNMIQLSSGENFRMLGMVNQVELLKPPEFKPRMQFTTHTPICISIKEEHHAYATYLSPTDECFAQAFAVNLVNKANALLGEEKYTPEQVEFNLLSEKIKAKLWKIKGIEIKGYLFDFAISAPEELIEVGYYSGFGNNGSSLGMGYCEVMNK